MSPWDIYFRMCDDPPSWFLPSLKVFPCALLKPGSPFPRPDISPWIRSLLSQLPATSGVCLLVPELHQFCGPTLPFSASSTGLLSCFSLSLSPPHPPHTLSQCGLPTPFCGGGHTQAESDKEIINSAGPLIFRTVGQYANQINIFTLVFVYCMYVPVMAPLGLAYAILKHLIDKYQLMNKIVVGTAPPPNYFSLLLPHFSCKSAHPPFLLSNLPGPYQLHSAQPRVHQKTQPAHLWFHPVCAIHMGW